MLAHRIRFIAAHGAHATVRLFGAPDCDMAAMEILTMFPLVTIKDVVAIEHDAPRQWGEQNANESAPLVDAIAARAKEKRVSLDVAEAQLRYAAKPFLVIWVDSHCQLPQRFDSLTEAFDFVQYQWDRIKRRVKEERYNSSSLSRGRMEGPGFSWSLRDVLLARDVSSY